MKKTIHLACLFSLLLIGKISAQQHGAHSTKLFSIPQIEKECRFFGGDTLSGFDLNAEVKKAVVEFRNISELKTYMAAKEIRFIRQKYNAPDFLLNLTDKPNAQKVTTPGILSSACNNVDFENGDFTGWTGSIGYNTNSNGPLVITGAGINTLGMDSPEPSCSYHTLVSTGNDPYSSLPMVDPAGGSYSVRLGGEDINQYYGSDQSGTYACTAGSGNGITTAYSGGEILQQTFSVTPSNALFSYSYSVLLNDGGHSNGQQPYFRLEVLDQNGTPIPCLQYYQQVASGVPPPGYTTSPTTNWLDNTTVYYCPWTQNSLNLSAYIGQNITIRFTAAGCNGGAHFGYAYVDCSCGPVQLITPLVNCQGTNSTLTAPPSVGGTYQWSGPGVVSGANSQVVTVSQSGTYSVTVTGAGGCSYTIDTTITFAPNPTVSVNSGAACGGTSVALNANGATTYSWSPGTGLSSTTGASVNANPSSTTVYTVTGSNAGCNGSATATVTVNPAPVLTVNSATICSGNSTTLNAGGANTYTWSPATGLSSTNGASVTASPTTTTTYTLTGTTSNGCVGTMTTAVTVNPMPTLTVNSATICPNATVTLTASGASTYSWNTGATTASISESPSSTTNYTVTGTATGGCVSTATTAVTVVSNLVITVNNATICAGNAATLNASGAATYSWSPGTGLSSTSGSSVNANPSSTTVYTITGTAGTCSAVTTATVTVNPGGAITVNSGTVCVGNSTTLNASGANTYTWSPAGSLSSTSGASVNANPTTTTNYTITGTDVNGCVFTATTAVNVNPLPVVTANSATVCSGGSATLNAGGASTYNWSTGATTSSISVSPASTTNYTVTGTDLNGCVGTGTTAVTVMASAAVTVNSATICAGGSTVLNASGASTYTWSPAGSLSASTGSSVTANPSATTVYTINATAGTCTATTTATVSVVSNPSVTVNSAAICSGSSATLNASGATTYTWSPATGLSSTTGSSVNANPTSSTVYTINATLGTCSATGTATVTVNALPTINSAPGFICNGGSTTLNANGASTYTWTPAATLSSSTGSSVTASPTVTTQYTVTGTDANGCVNAANTSVTVVSNPTISINSASICLGQQTATLTAFGASSFNWVPNTGLSSSSGSSVIANPSTTTVYTITGTIGSCTATATTTVTVNPLPVVGVSSNSPVCVNATLNLNATGGNNYVWMGPGTFTSTQQNPSINGVSASAAGVYTVGVSDANSCVNSATVSVTVNPLPAVTANGATVCLGSAINLSANNGGVNYSWSGPGMYSSNQQNPSIANASAAMAGSYVVTVTDANGCANGNVAQVVVNPLPTINSNSPTICAVGSATLSASGGISYTWSPATGLSSTNGSSVTSSVSSTTNYTITGSDANGCVGSTSTTVFVNPLPPVAVGPMNASGCAPLCVNFVNTTGSSGSYSWSFGDGAIGAGATPNHCFNTAGNYPVTLTLTDGNGCTNTANAMVMVYPVPTAAFYTTPSQASTLEPNISFFDNSGGAVIVGWNWNFGDMQQSTSTQQNPMFTYADAGSYNVQLQVTSDHGCTSIATQVITIDEEYAIYVPNAFSPNADGSNDVFMAKGEGIKEFSMYIFDRWGNEVFYSDKIEKGWDGTMRSKSEEVVQEDVYVWKIELKNNKGTPKSLSGVVSVVK